MSLLCSIFWTAQKKVKLQMAKLSRRYQRDTLPDGKQFRLKNDDPKLPKPIRRSREQHAKEKKHGEDGKDD